MVAFNDEAVVAEEAVAGDVYTIANVLVVGAPFLDEPQGKTEQLEVPPETTCQLDASTLTSVGSCMTLISNTSTMPPPPSKDAASVNSSTLARRTG
ncbi:hypothetical protein PR048_012374 [Dryococelus australis]|uniref:Uncharacterized protein n=1 Tax=Dryococelus australis TaxID=614101 RepID=A0ABQ9HPQ8_9NEOP|nr:hypothetical protein PR048_012374 [Dryococelus australis]